MTGGVHPGLATALAPRSDLPLRYMLSGAAFYLVAQVALVARAEGLAQGVFLWWPVAGVAHLFTLGWASMIIMGASYQLIPVLLRVRLRSEALGRATWWAFATGVALFALGLLQGRQAWLAPAGALLMAAILAYGANVVLTLRAAPRGPLQRWALGWAAGSYAVAALLGGGMALALGSGRSEEVAFARLLGAHLAAGLGGWMSVTVFAVSYRLVPMFSLSHGYSQARHPLTVTLLLAGSLLLALGALLGRRAPEWAGALSVAASYVLYTLDVADVVRHRRRRRLEPVTWFTLTGLAFALLALVLGGLAFLEWGAPSAGRLAVAAAYSFLGGWVSLMVAGHLLKIVPFLTWLDRYAARAAVEKVPLVRDLFSPWLAEATLLLTAGGAAVAVAGIVAGSVAVARLGLALTLVGALGLVAALLQVRAGWRVMPRP